MTDLNIDLLYSKKWRQLKERHGSLDRDPGDVYVSALKELYGDAFKVSPWTEAHVHHWVKNEKPIFWGSASCGKFVLKDEPVFTDNGPIRIGDVSVGDRIISSTGRLVRIRGVYDQTDRPLFRMNFADGTSTICGDEHLWTVRYLGRKRWIGPRKTRKSEMGLITRVKTTEELWRIKPSSFRRKHYAVPLVSPVRFAHVEVPIDPYVLGCLLGDGSFASGGVSFTSDRKDVEVRSEFGRRLSEKFPDMCLRLVNGGKGTDYMVVRKDKSYDRNPMKEALERLGLFGHRSYDKFIPKEYLYNDIDTRLDLLAGLMDTDGTVDTIGRASICSASKELINGIRFLVESLGGYSSIREKHPTYRHNGELRSGRVSYELVFRGLGTKMLKRMFKLSRKRNRAKERSRGVGYKPILSIERIENRKDYPSETRCITIEELDDDGNPTNGLFPIGHFTVTHNSNDVAACAVPHWMVEPYDTIILVGSTTKDALRIRVWEAIERYFATAKQYGKEHGFLVPGKVTQTGYSILNDRQADDNPNAQGGKAGIHGVALNEGGKLQGAHLPSVVIIIDELATINNHQDILTTISNLLVTEDFKFAAMANPEPWSNPSSSIYCTPVDGISSVSVDTREWDTTFGAKVLHDDGLKSPCVLDPSLGPEFPFLTQEKHIQRALQVAGGNENAASFWKMARGFPTPVATGMPPILDPMIAVNMKVQEKAPPLDYSTVVATAAGIDPAWTEGGDGACRARVYVRRDSFGKMYLDFTDGLTRLNINAQDTQHPAVQQMRTQVLAKMREPFEASFANTAIDASANQGLADDLLIYAGANCLAVNNSERASEAPLRATDLKPIKDTIYDRGTEAWVVLAEFCKAGMVRGLPAEAVRALTMRSYAVNRDKEGNVLNQKFPLRLEEKKLFKPKFKHSPDECDACALAALAVKERIGLLPFGYLTSPVRNDAFQQVQQTTGPTAIAPSESYDSSFDDTGESYDDPFG